MSIKISEVKNAMSACKNNAQAWEIIVKHFYQLDPNQKSKNPAKSEPIKLSLDMVMKFVELAPDRDVLELRDLIEQRFPRSSAKPLFMEMLEDADDEDLGIDESNSLPTLAKTLPKPTAFDSLNIGFDVIENLEMIFVQKTNFGNDGIFEIVKDEEKEKLEKAKILCKKHNVFFPFDLANKKRLKIKNAMYNDGDKIKVNVKFSKWGPFDDRCGYSCYIQKKYGKKK